MRTAGKRQGALAEAPPLCERAQAMRETFQSAACIDSCLGTGKKSSYTLVYPRPGACPQHDRERTVP